MGFEETKKELLDRRSRTNYQNIFQTRPEEYDDVVQMIQDLEKCSTTDDVVLQVPDDFYKKMDTIARRLEDTLFFHKLTTAETAFLNNFYLILMNWVNVKHAENFDRFKKYLTHRLERIQILLGSRFSMMDLFTLLRSLENRIRNTLDNEPYSARISDMYRRELDDYFRFLREHPEPYDTASPAYDAKLKEQADANDHQADRPV